MKPTADPKWQGSIDFLPVLCILLILVVDRVLDHSLPLVVSGTLDEIGHLLTGLVFALALRAVRLPVRLPAVLAGAVVVDLDHLFLWLGWLGRLDGTSRNIFHNLTLIWLCLMAAAMLADRATLFTSLAVGIASHLCRDLATGTVPLAWPVLETVKSVTYKGYLLVLIGLAAIAAAHGAASLRKTGIIDDPPRNDREVTPRDT